MSTPSRNGNMQDRAAGIYAYAQRSLDHYVPPSTRERSYDAVSAFAAARPILFSFIVVQVMLSILPALLFTTFAVSTVATSLAAALLFALFWVAVAFMVLVPVLLATASFAVLIWVWALGGFLVAQWLYRRVNAEVVKDDKQTSWKAKNGEQEQDVVIKQEHLQ